MKILLAYYSLNGNTKTVAEKLAKALNVDLLQIRTVKEYPDDYDVLLSLGKKEVESGYLPAIQPVTRNLEEYDILVLGTPVWWSSFAPAVRRFISLYRWKGKRVFPFATNEGTLGHTASDLKKALRGATVEPILNVKFKEGEQVTSESALSTFIQNVKNTVV